MAEQEPPHFSLEHVQNLKWQAKPHSLQPKPIDRLRSDTPLVDALIERTADEIAKSEWRGLMEIEPSKEDLQRVKEFFKENKGQVKNP